MLRRAACGNRRVTKKPSPRSCAFPVMGIMGAEPSGRKPKPLVLGKISGEAFMLGKFATSVGLIGLAAALAAAAPAGARDTALQMVSIDVEGGGGTPFVTPESKSLLIDTRK